MDYIIKESQFYVIKESIDSSKQEKADKIKGILNAISAKLPPKYKFIGDAYEKAIVSSNPPEEFLRNLPKEFTEQMKGYFSWLKTNTNDTSQDIVGFIRKLRNYLKNNIKDAKTPQNEQRIPPIEYQGLRVSRSLFLGGPYGSYVLAGGNLLRWAESGAAEFVKLLLLIGTFYFAIRIFYTYIFG